MAELEQQEQEVEQTGFVIGGDVYPIPSLYSLDMDENQIMFDLSGRPTEDWLMMIEAAKAGSLEDGALGDYGDEIRRPGFLRAFVHIAYRRAHPEADFSQVELVVGKSSQLANWAALYLPGQDEEAEDPQGASPTMVSDGSGSELAKPGNGDSPTTPGTSSSKSSEKPGATHEPTGTSESDTSSPVLTTWAS